MDGLKEMLKLADDDYLISLSNKGTLKRAAKDLETTSVSVTYMDGAAYIMVGKEHCVITSDLASASCTCPSRGICRHIITSVLYLRKELIKRDDKPQIKEKTDKTKEKTPEDLISSLSGIELKKIRSAMKKQYYNEYIQKARANVLPVMEEMKVITVDFPDEGVIVKLVYPLEYSACTCHSNDFCRHKAAAVLTWQLCHGVLKTEDLEEQSGDSTEINISKIKELSADINRFITKLFTDGLARFSDAVCDNAEAYAVACHNLRNANGERIMREITARLGGYIDHSPDYNSNILVNKLMKAFCFFSEIVNEDEYTDIKDKIGEFKETYEFTRRLELIPLADRHIITNGGYEGNIYYYLNKDVKSRDKFFTFSDVRPVFYERSHNRKNVSASPWNLNQSISSIKNKEIILETPKISGGKISSSKKTTAEITGDAQRNCQAVFSRIYEDYYKMTTDMMMSDTENETDRLVLFYVHKTLNYEFDEIRQTCTVTVSDTAGRKICLKAVYKENEKDYFESFMKTGQIMSKSGDPYVIFGSTYIDGGRLCVYPIAVYQSINFIPTGTAKEEYPELSSEKENNFFASYFHEVRSVLYDIAESGIRTYSLFGEVEELALTADRSGLENLHTLLDELYNEINMYNRNINAKTDRMVNIMCRIGHYAEIGLKKTEFNMVIGNLY